MNNFLVSLCLQNVQHAVLIFVYSCGFILIPRCFHFDAMTKIETAEKRTSFRVCSGCVINDSAVGTNWQLRCLFMSFIIMKFKILFHKARVVCA